MALLWDKYHSPDSRSVEIPADRPERRLAGADQHVCSATKVTGAGDLQRRHEDCMLNKGTMLRQGIGR